MKNIVHNHRGNTESGISLLEVLLSVGVGAVIVLGATKMAQDWAERVRHREEASYMVSINNAARTYVESNFGEILQTGFDENMGDTNGDGVIDNDDMSNIGRAIMIPVENNGGNFYLKDNSIALSENFPSTTPSGRDVKIYVRNLGFIGNVRTLEILTTTTASVAMHVKPQNELDARDIAQAIGADAGVFSVRDGGNDCTSGSFQSLFGSWRLDNDTLTGRMMSGSPDYCPDIDPAGGLGAYVAIQSRVTYQTASTNNYLYRVAIPGQPEINRMETNINMNNHAIVNGASMTVDNLQVTGNADIAAPTGTTALFVDEGLRVAGTGSRINAKGDDSDPLNADCFLVGPNNHKTLNPAAPGSCRLIGGDLRVSGASSAPGRASLQVSSLNAPAASLSANQMNVNGFMGVGGNMGIQNNLNVTGNAGAGSAVTPTATVGNRLTTTALQVANDSSIPNFRSGSMTAKVMNADDNVTTSSMQVVYDLGVGGNTTFSQGLTAAQFQATVINHCTATVMHRYPWGPNDYVTVAPYDCTGDGPN